MRASARCLYAHHGKFYLARDRAVALAFTDTDLQEILESITFDSGIASIQNHRDPSFDLTRFLHANRYPLRSKTR
jgi:hypothetical protein